MAEHQTPTTDIDVLREMVRLAENLRKETVQGLERLNQYNLALIAFDAGFLSFLVSNSFEKFIIQPAGFLLLASTFVSLFALSPRRIRGAVLRIDEDVKAIHNGEMLDIREFLLVTAEITDRASLALQKRAKQRKFFTILSSLLLALALTITYTLYAYA